MELLLLNATHLYQPLDYLSIQKLKEYWRSGWEYKKVEVIPDGEWSVCENFPGKSLNTGKEYGDIKVKRIQNFDFCSTENRMNF